MNVTYLDVATLALDTTFPRFGVRFSWTNLTSVWIGHILAIADNGKKYMRYQRE